MDKTAYNRVKLARSSERPTGLDYINHLFEGFFELHGDRRFGDDPAVVGGIACLQGLPVTVIAIEKGHTAKERAARNFGAPNPEGFACMMYCEAAANDSEEAEQITKEQYFNEYGWTDEMWEMRSTIFEMLREHPVFDFYKGISDKMFDTLDNPSKDAYHNGASWTQTRENILNTVQSEVDAANSALES